MLEKLTRDQYRTLLNEYVRDEIYCILHEALMWAENNFSTSSSVAIWRESAHVVQELSKICRPKWELNPLIEEIKEKTESENDTILVLATAMYRLLPSSSIDARIKETLVELSNLLKANSLFVRIRLLVCKYETEEAKRNGEINVRDYALKQINTSSTDEDDNRRARREVVRQWCNIACKSVDDILIAEITTMEALNRIYNNEFDDYVRRLHNEQEARVKAMKEPRTKIIYQTEIETNYGPNNCPNLTSYSVIPKLPAIDNQPLIEQDRHE